MKTKFNTIFIGLLCAAGLAASLAASSARAEEFFTPRALLSQHFHASERVTFVQITLTAEQRTRVEQRLGRALSKSKYTFFVAATGGKVDGYALFDDQLGQHEPISFVTFLDRDGAVTRVEVVAYREPYGDGIRAERFRKQFVGRTAVSKFRPGDDIDAISGATISSRSMCIGVERATALFDEAIAKHAPTVLASITRAPTSTAAR